MILVRPSVSWQDSYVAAVREFHAEGRHLDLSVERLEADFARHVRRLLDMEFDPPAGLVPEVYWWGVTDRGFVGRVSLRTRLSPRLLRAGGHIGYEVRPSARGRGYGHALLRSVLPLARQRGLRHVLLTCDESNVASARVIEGAGGVLENVLDVPEMGGPKRRYWITLGE